MSSPLHRQFCEVIYAVMHPNSPDTSPFGLDAGRQHQQTRSTILGSNDYYLGAMRARGELCKPRSSVAHNTPVYLPKITWIFLEMKGTSHVACPLELILPIHTTSS
ncbi:hypothetical protein PM082_006802 [Marasmius tenuissimus]|nr:hypothetical protein PM082_006802 [Marasmius tenuissimus]